ncbi:Lrp/AsnC family transcriptional regulator [Ktedonosporobacter rubrisoli]|uniref:Lrp/AsnC family transcriptional regulator n=1 Tax=Ktedonosporobacter rubrisoli TaxID=2509675 RepID=A0A4P6JNP4_KTERU|nr:Lrp/AsnC family transcriptional regulator [Ktedonosporobacter rubrisoli]QBD76692.1 Lrp/AsnC family transcriptional regulator [Ktedonosporobacter rubrisoli]
MQLDEVDKAILQALQEDGRLSLRKLAQRVHMTAPSVAERVRRLEEQRIIVGYAAQIDSNKVSPMLTAFIHVFLSKREGNHRSFLRFVEGREEICECYHTAGDSCHLLKVMVPDHACLDALVNELLVYGDYRLHLVIGEPLKKQQSYGERISSVA